MERTVFSTNGATTAEWPYEKKKKRSMTFTPYTEINVKTKTLKFPE